MRRGVADRSARASDPPDLFHRPPSDAAGFVTNSTVQNNGLSRSEPLVSTERTTSATKAQWHLTCTNPYRALVHVSPVNKNGGADVFVDSIDD